MDADKCNPRGPTRLPGHEWKHQEAYRGQHVKLTLTEPLEPGTVIYVRLATGSRGLRVVAPESVKFEKEGE